MTETRIYLFGPPRIERNGKEISVSRRKVQALLAYLSASDQVYTRDHLATLLWPEDDATNSRANLRRELYRLKQIVDEPVLNLDGDHVAINAQFGLWVDVREFNQQIGLASQHHHPDGQLCPVCLAAWKSAAQLYKDDFLSGFGLPDSAGFDDWQFFQSDSLRRSLAEALGVLSGWHGKQGEYENGIEYARRLLALDPLHEPAHRELMRLYAWAGQPAAALRQYQECARLLKKELGLQPEEETRVLHEQIQSRQLQPPDTRTDEAEPAHNLPEDATPFFGRERELADLAGMLADPTARMVTLVGFGGIGKTRLALAAARQAAQLDPPLFTAGITFIPLADVDGPEGLAASIARALGITLAGEGDPLEQVTGVLRAGPRLLLLDNFEQLLDAAPQLNRLLEASSNLKLLITSREPLRLLAEWQYNLDGLEFPQEGDQNIGDFPAVRLFVQAAHQVRPDFRLTEESAANIGRLCRLVGGTPLAIRLAASWMHVISCGEIVAEVERGMLGLTSRMRDVPARHRSMQAVFEYTWSMLEPEERNAFQVLSVFRGGFAAHAAELATGVTPFQLAGLLERGILQSASPERYQIHELTRQFAASKLRESGQEQEITRRHALYFLGLAADRAAALHGNAPGEVLAAYQRDMPNFRKAWEWAVDQAEFGLIEMAMDAAIGFFELSGPFSLGERLFAELSGRLETQQVEEPAGTLEPSRFQALLCRALLQRVRFGLDHSRTLNLHLDIERACTLAQALERSDLIAECAYIQGMNYTFQGETRKAIASLGEAAALFERSGQPRRKGESLNYLGEALNLTSQPDRALACHNEALDIGVSLGDVHLQAVSLSHIGVTYYYQDDYRSALGHWQQSLERFEQIHFWLGVGRTSNNMAYVNNLIGEWTAAMRQIKKAVTTLRRLGATRDEANALDTRGDIYFALGDYEKAEASYRQALEVSHQTQMMAREEGSFLVNLARITAARGEYEQAVELLGQAVQVKAIDHPKEKAKMIAVQAKISAGCGQSAQALEHWQKAIELLEQSGEFNTRAALMLQKAAFLLENGETAKSANLIDSARHIAERNHLPPLRIEADLLKARLLGLEGEDENACLLLEDLLTRDTMPFQRAAIHYEFWRLGQNNDHACKAADLYRIMVKTAPDVFFQQRLTELNAATDR